MRESPGLDVRKCEPLQTDTRTHDMADPKCECAEALRRSFECVEDAVFGPLARTIVENSDLVARVTEKWMSVYRCRTCGTGWVEASASSGMMEIQHLFPLPHDATDAKRWIEEAGEPLPLRRWL